MADGLLNLNKPHGISSAKALYRVRRITGIRKSGHAGTLDPAATGVLLLCLGRGTKLVERLMDQPKVYRATARLDVTSASFDAECPLIEVPAAHRPALAEVEAAARRFEGQIQQTPPMLSAVKVGGRPAYQLARRGETVELRSRAATIYWLEIRRYAWPELDFEMACGRGTYVRSLIRDLGAALGTGGCLTSLERTAIGPFGLAEAVTPEALEQASDPLGCVVPLERAVELLADVRVPSRPAG